MNNFNTEGLDSVSDKMQLEDYLVPKDHSVTEPEGRKPEDHETEGDESKTWEPEGISRLSTLFGEMSARYENDQELEIGAESEQGSIQESTNTDDDLHGYGPLTIAPALTDNKEQSFQGSNIVPTRSLPVIYEVPEEGESIHPCTQDRSALRSSPNPSYQSTGKRSGKSLDNLASLKALSSPALKTTEDVVIGEASQAQKTTMPMLSVSKAFKLVIGRRNDLEEKLAFAMSAFKDQQKIIKRLRAEEETAARKAEQIEEISIPMLSLKNALQVVTQNRDVLEAQLTYAISAFYEQQNLIDEYDKIAVESQALLLQGAEAMRGGIPKNRSTRNTWIGGTWLAGTSTALQAVERSWETGRTQEALSSVSQVASTKNISTEDFVNAKLLRAVILRSSGLEQEALKSVEEVVEMAYEYGFVVLAGKAQFHRALTLLYLDRFAESSWCFLLASHTPEHGLQIEVNREVAERKRLDLSIGDSARYLPPDFATYRINRAIQ